MRLPARRPQRIHVETEQGLPTRLLWERRPYRVHAVLDDWYRCDGWYLHPSLRGVSRHYFRLEISDTGSRHNNDNRSNNPNRSSNLSPSNNQSNNPHQQRLCVEVYCQRRVWVLYRIAD